MLYVFIISALQHHKLSEKIYLSLIDHTIVKVKEFVIIKSQLSDTVLVIINFGTSLFCF